MKLRVKCLLGLHNVGLPSIADQDQLAQDESNDHRHHIVLESSAHRLRDLRAL
jgi:hypothetical protein